MQPIDCQTTEQRKATLKQTVQQSDYKFSICKNKQLVKGQSWGFKKENRASVNRDTVSDTYNRISK
jgi:hypothetical protein